MSESIVHTLKELIEQGTKLAPIGGFDYSGYNARLQNKYLEWRKSCLELFDAAGPIGFPNKSKVLAHANGGLYYQSSVMFILTCLNELYEKLRTTPDLAVAPAPIQVVEARPEVIQESGGKRILKPPKKSSDASAPPPGVTYKKAYIIGEEDDPLHVQLVQFIHEIGLEEIIIERQRGQMLPLDTIPMDADARFAFFIITADDLAYAMFEIGHFVGKLGKNRVCVIHSPEVSFPNNMPGVLVKVITMKLEEASFGLMKDLKAAGYQINF
jgi:hypothetical protein